MDENVTGGSRRSQFLHWLENVFWYHYKWYYFAAVFVLVIVLVSVISFATKVKYDWTVQYVHAGLKDPDSVAYLHKRYTEAGTDVTGNGKVQVQIAEHPASDAPGRQDLMGLVRDSDNILYVLDTETYELYHELGYFGEGVELGNGLWALLLDTPITPYTWEEFEAYGWTEESWIEANEYRTEQHALMVAEAENVMEHLR